MKAHPIQWQAPRPLWARFGLPSAAGATVADQDRPAILRFASDDFMEQMLGTLARDPSRIDALVARPETWRAPMAEAPVPEQADLIERTPIPGIADTVIRRLLARKPKQSIPATVPEAEDPYAQGQARLLPLKLYQPAHQRYYLVVSSLICGVPGFPERAVALGAAEQVNWVIRRLLPETFENTNDLREFAYINDSQGKRWQRVNEDDSRIAAGEELLPVFPLSYWDDAVHPRILWGGFVPVGRREEYVSANVDQPSTPTSATGQQLPATPETPATRPSKLARVTQFQMEVAEPWKNLIRSSYRTAESLDRGEDEPSDKKAKRVFEFNLQQQNVSWLILLDFADFLSLHLDEVWKAVETGDAGPLALHPKRKELYEWLDDAEMSAGLINALKEPIVALIGPGTRKEWRTPEPSLRAALKAIRAPGVREKLEGIEYNYTNDPTSLGQGDWPNFHFVLAGLNTANTPDGPFTRLQLAGEADGRTEFIPDPPVPPSTQAQMAAEVDRLTTLVGKALEANQETGAPPLPFALQLKNSIAANLKISRTDPGWFVARFVYTRRDCGPLHPPLLSAPTQRFQLASFFDPDAPARPIRISLPLDTSPAGLRKYSKNTAFVLSDMLCGQVQRAKSLGFIDLVLAVLPWPFHKDLDVGAGGPCKMGSIDIGMICSLSIPIITICALILLIIIVSLLDLIFHWLPFFIMCFPLPWLKGKKK